MEENEREELTELNEPDPLRLLGKMFEAIEELPEYQEYLKERGENDIESGPIIQLRVTKSEVKDL